MTESKPVPPVEIVTDEAAAARYDAALEAWGERLRSAGVRVCEWLNQAAKDADYKCGDGIQAHNALTKYRFRLANPVR